MKNKWTVSVTELLIIFRGALLAIIPWIEKAKIKWKEHEAYDDWDNIAESLYKNIVCSSLTGEVTSQYTIAKYNFDYDDYSSVDFIGVRNKKNSAVIYAFIAFQSKSYPLDSVRIAELSKNYNAVNHFNVDIDELEFVFLKKINSKREVIETIDVVL